MFRTVADVIDIIRISGVGGFRRLVGHSKRLKKHGTSFAVMHCLIALERTGIGSSLRSKDGLDVHADPKLDAATLSAVCEYLYERSVLIKLGAGTYRVRDLREFEFLTDAMHACCAYCDPIQALDRLITREFSYGEEVARSDKYDAAASATLTSIFSFGFAHRVLVKSGARSLLDCGCGTGEFLSFLQRKGFAGRLFGMDLAGDAIEDGRSAGYESERVKLFVGDVLDLRRSLAGVGSPEIDIFSFMFVLHEFSDEHVATVLSQVAEACPKARVLLTELERRTSEETRRAARTMLPELKFVHLLSKQILRSSGEWRQLFAEAGFQPVIEKKNRLTDQLCLLFAPS